MTASAPEPTLPAGHSAYPPGRADLDDLVRLLRRHERAVRGRAGTDIELVEAEVTGRGASTHRHILIRDRTGTARAWINCHDRAAGRVKVGITIDPDLTTADADGLAAYGFSRAAEIGHQVMGQRGLSTTQLDSGAYAEDPRQQRWLREFGYEHVRDWLQMSRPVDRQTDLAPAQVREGVRVRRVRADQGAGMPDEQDLRAVHLVLEESFADHFNSYREPFEEFVERLREAPGHRWDHWWLAFVDDEPAGALVASTVPGQVGDDGIASPDSSHVEYIGVHRSSRGKGVAKSLLHTVIADAAVRGRGSVDLEVDAHSPTGADGIYASMGWQTVYTTQSWHRVLRTD